MNELMDVIPAEDREGTTEELIAETLCIREELSEKRKEWETFEAMKKERLEIIQMRLREIADSVGTDSLKCKFGTAFKQVKEYFRVGDWDQIVEYIKETGNFHMLEKRIGKLATKEIYEVTGKLPPGVEYSSEIEMVIRKAPTKERT
jgi:hypothetical protein